jgi:hypothetical protein
MVVWLCPWGSKTAVAPQAVGTDPSPQDLCNGSVGTCCLPVGGTSGGRLHFLKVPPKGHQFCKIPWMKGRDWSSAEASSWRVVFECFLSTSGHSAGTRIVAQGGTEDIPAHELHSLPRKKGQEMHKCDIS